MVKGVRTISIIGNFHKKDSAIPVFCTSLHAKQTLSYRLDIDFIAQRYDAGFLQAAKSLNARFVAKVNIFVRNYVNVMQDYLQKLPQNPTMLTSGGNTYTCIGKVDLTEYFVVVKCNSVLFYEKMC